MVSGDTHSACLNLKGLIGFFFIIDNSIFTGRVCSCQQDSNLYACSKAVILELSLMDDFTSVRNKNRINSIGFGVDIECPLLKK